MYMQCSIMRYVLSDKLHVYNVHVRLVLDIKLTRSVNQIYR